MDIKAILRKGYTLQLLPDEDGTFTSLVQEFPGVIAQGDTAAEAVENLEQAAAGWIGAMLATGQAIPEPAVQESFGGRVALRLPRSLHRRVAEAASADDTSINQWIVSALSYQLGTRKAAEPQHRTNNIIYTQNTMNVAVTQDAATVRSLGTLVTQWQESIHG